MRVVTGIRQLLTMVARDGDPLGIIEDAAIAIDDAGRVAWTGRAADAPSSAARLELGGVVVLPGLVDPHTHLVFAGDRAADFEARCRGESYVAIAQRGGGIRTTVRATRAASEDELVRLASPRLAALAAHGVTTVEIKSGYGLDVETELRQLRAIARLSALGPQRLAATLLLHVVPDSHAADRAGWLTTIERELLPAAVGLADAVDVFCDVGAYTRDEAWRALVAARALGFRVKAHVEQLTATGFGVDAAAMGALSLEHLEHAGDEVVAAMARAGTVAVLLPTASLFLGDAARPPVAALRAAGVRLALATDLNPGSSPTFDPWLVATLACTWYGLTPAESLLGVTAHAAAALGRGDVGRLAPGAWADLAVARPDLPDWRHLVYGLGHRPIARTVIGGIELPARA
ncbi:MAG: imidazolonepropionase [Deltaproteobacteria bacterium]|nr:imidazolonepropionase [Deltaproteobacteria bacterium]